MGGPRSYPRRGGVYGKRTTNLIPPRKIIVVEQILAPLEASPKYWGFTKMAEVFKKLVGLHPSTEASPNK